MRGSAAQARLFGAVGARGVLAVLEVVADLVEALLRDEVLAIRAQVAAVDEGVDEGVGVRAQGPAAGDAADAFEAEGVPDAARGDVGLVDEVEDRVGVALGWGVSLTGQEGAGEEDIAREGIGGSGGAEHVRKGLREKR